MGIMIGPDTPVGDVARIDTVAGAGDTEDGVNPAADATVFTLIDLGDARNVGLADPSDRKLYFLAPLVEPGTEFEGDDPFLNGVTFVVRFRILPIMADVDMATDDFISNQGGDPYVFENPVTYLYETSDRVHVGVGYVDPDFPELNVIAGVGYYSENAVSICVNTFESATDGGDNVPIGEGPIDNTEFHTIWVNAKTDETDNLLVNVRAFIDGGTTATEAQIVREVGGEDLDLPDPEEMDDYTGLTQLCVNLGSAGTPNTGAFQFDYVAASIDGAFDPVPGAGVPVLEWSLY